MNRPDVRGSLYGYRLTDRLTKHRGFKMTAGHWQALTPRLSLQANALYESDQNFNNLYSRDDRTLVRQDSDSNLALTYSHPAYSARIFTDQKQVFSAARNKFLTQNTSWPQAGIQSSPLRIGGGVFATLSGNVTNSYNRPADPINPELDHYQQTADASAALSRNIRVSSTTSLVPSAGVASRL